MNIVSKPKREERKKETFSSGHLSKYNTLVPRTLYESSIVMPRVLGNGALSPNTFDTGTLVGPTKPKSTFSRIFFSFASPLVLFLFFLDSF